MTLSTPRVLSTQIPVTVLNGSSGAGKTSVLKHVLASSGLRIAIIVNDVAEFSFDFKQMKDPRSNVSFAMGMEVLGGCICCTRRETFVERLMAIAQSKHVDHIVVESAGVAEPLHVAENFALAQEVVSLDTMVTVVDALVAVSTLGALTVLSNMNKAARANALSKKVSVKHSALFSPAARLLVEQVCFSNVVLLNKCDKIGADVASELCKIFQRLNPQAKVHSCIRGRVPTSLLLNTSTFSMEQAEDDDRWFAEAESGKLGARCLSLKRTVWWAGVFSKPSNYFATNPSAQELSKACASNDVNETDDVGDAALMEAVRLNWPAGVRELIKMKADVDLTSNRKVSPLHIGVPHRTEIVQILLEARADPNCQDLDPEHNPNWTSRTFAERLEHRTPLHYACLAGDATTVSLLINANARVDIQDAQCDTPLRLAIAEEQVGIIDILLRSRADVNLGNIASGLQNTPLMDAARHGKHELTEKLISANADVNKQGKQGMSALHLAVRSGHTIIVKQLIMARAEMMQICQSGTARDLAQKRGGVEMLQLFGISQPASHEKKQVASIQELDASQRAALFLE